MFKTQQKVTIVQRPVNVFSKIFKGVPFTIINLKDDVACIHAGNHESSYLSNGTIPANGLTGTRIYVDLSLIEPIELSMGRPPAAWFEWIKTLSDDQIEEQILSRAAIRKHLAMTQQDIAVIMKIKRQNVNMLENLKEYSRNLVCRYLYAIDQAKIARGA